MKKITAQKSLAALWGVSGFCIVGTAAFWTSTQVFVGGDDVVLWTWMSPYLITLLGVVGLGLKNAVGQDDGMPVSDLTFYWVLGASVLYLLVFTFYFATTITATGEDANRICDGGISTYACMLGRSEGILDMLFGITAAGLGGFFVDTRQSSSGS